MRGFYSPGGAGGCLPLVSVEGDGIGGVAAGLVVGLRIVAKEDSSFGCGFPSSRPNKNKTSSAPLRRLVILRLISSFPDNTSTVCLYVL